MEFQLRHQPEINNCKVSNILTEVLEHYCKGSGQNLLLLTLADHPPLVSIEKEIHQRLEFQE